MVHCIILLRDYRLYNFSKIIVLLSLKIDIVIENRADSDEMPLIWVFTVKVSHRISHFGYVSMGRTSDTLIGYLPIFQMLPKTSLCIRYHWYLFDRKLDVLETN